MVLKATQLANEILKHLLMIQGANHTGQFDTIRQHLWL